MEKHLISCQHKFVLNLLDLLFLKFLVSFACVPIRGESCSARHSHFVEFITNLFLFIASTVADTFILATWGRASIFLSCLWHFECGWMYFCRSDYVIRSQYFFMTDVIYLLSHEHVRSSICMRIVWCIRPWLCMSLLLLLLIQSCVCVFSSLSLKNVIHNRVVATIYEVLRWKCTCVCEWGE